MYLSFFILLIIKHIVSYIRVHSGIVALHVPLAWQTAVLAPDKTYLCREDISFSQFMLRLKIKRHNDPMN